MFSCFENVLQGTVVFRSQNFIKVSLGKYFHEAVILFHEYYPERVLSDSVATDVAN